MKRRTIVLLRAATLLAIMIATATVYTAAGDAANPNWPNEPGEDPTEEMPDDPGYFHPSDSEGVSGQWYLWSFYPQEWLEINDGRIRSEELELGTGMHADRGWQYTTGDRRVVVAVIDSGARWSTDGIREKYYLHRPELDRDGARPVADCLDEAPEDPFDLDGNGYLSILDYVVCDGEEARLDGMGNGNGHIDAQDLIIAFSDGVDDDGNGFIDDISGWDFMWDDNDAYDDPHFNHGKSEAQWSLEQGNDGRGNIGVCPGCSLLMMRAGDSFVAEVNDFAASVIYAVDNGADVIQEALGTINMNDFTYQAIDYAYYNNVPVVASAADELSFHPNFPGTANHTIYVHAIIHDNPSRPRSTTFLNYNNCTNHGAHLVLSSSGQGCSSQATGMTAGHAGLLLSWGVQNELDPPLTAEEVRALMTTTATDIAVNPDDNDPEKFQSGPGWDFHFGYGRNNIGDSLERLAEGRLPPELDIVTPYWFETFYPERTGTEIVITGRVGSRPDGLDPRYDSYTWELEAAPGKAPAEAAFMEMASGTTEGIDGEIATIDITPILDLMNIEDPPVAPHAYGITLRLSACATADAGETCSEFRKFIYADEDEDLREGFPIHLGSSGEASPTFYDLDGDGDDELILPTSDGYLHVYQEDATELEGFPIALGWRRGYDPDAEVNHYDQCAFRTEREGCPQWGPITAEPRQAIVTNTVAIANLAGDEEASPQIVITTADGYLWVFEVDGSLVDGFPVRTNVEFSINGPFGGDDRIDEGILSSPVLEDLDGNGDYEIIVGAMDQHLYVWDHDGEMHPGFPVLCRDSEEAGGGHGARIISTPAVGDVDADGHPEILLGTNEVYGEVEGRIYLLHHNGNENPDGPFENLDPDRESPGPFRSAALQGDVLPVVGRGNPSNGILADWDLDGYVEFALEGIGGVPTMRQWDGTELTDETIMSIATEDFGPLSNSTDDFSYTLINNGAFGILDPSGDLSIVKGSAGFRFALAFIGDGVRIDFDHQLAAWNTRTGMPLEGFPQVQDDWQFFMTPSIVDIDGDELPEIINGSGGYRLRAHNYRGEEPDGWPKHTGGWIVTSPAIGDFDGDGLYDIAVNTRNGWLFVFKTEGPTSGPVQWNGYAHDHRNTNNFETEMPYGFGRTIDPPTGDDVGVDAGDDAGPGGEDADAGPAVDTDPSGDDGGETRDDDTGGTPDGSEPDGATGGGGGGGGGGGCASVPQSGAPIAALLGVIGVIALLRRRR